MTLLCTDLFDEICIFPITNSLSLSLSVSLLGWQRLLFQEAGSQPSTALVFVAH